MACFSEGHTLYSLDRFKHLLMMSPICSGTKPSAHNLDEALSFNT